MLNRPPFFKSSGGIPLKNISHTKVCARPIMALWIDSRDTQNISEVTEKLLSYITVDCLSQCALHVVCF